MGIKQDLVATGGEFVGTTMFIFLGLGGVKTAQNAVTAADTQTAATITLSNQTILFISLSMGFSLLINAWIFYRITGGLFNPAVTLALWLIGAVHTIRAILLTLAQIAGGIAGAGLVALLTPYQGVSNTITTLAFGMNKAQGLWLEAFLTAMLVFTVLMLAAEKHKATFIAPIGIGLTLFVCQLFGTLWTGCGMNPARAFGPSVIERSWPGYHWIYWAGPYIGSLIAVGFYALLKMFDYGSVVLGQDSDKDGEVAPLPMYTRAFAHMQGFSHQQRRSMKAAGLTREEIDRQEDAMVQASVQNAGLLPGQIQPIIATDKSSRRSDTRVRVKSSDMHNQEAGGMSPPGTHAHPLNMKGITGIFK